MLMQSLHGIQTFAARLVKALASAMSFHDPGKMANQKLTSPGIATLQNRSCFAPQSMITHLAFAISPSTGWCKVSSLHATLYLDMPVCLPAGANLSTVPWSNKPLKSEDV